MSTSCRCDRRRRIAILGATGSIGRNAVAVAAAHPERFEVECVTCRSRSWLLREAAEKCHAAESFCRSDPQPSTIGSEAQLEELLASDRVDVVLCAIQGVEALPAVLAALRAGKTVALATKEVLVAAGGWVMDTARRHGGKILPVDSEHCAIFQCLEGKDTRDVKRLWLTCSGGPFHFHPELNLHEVTVEQASRHPAWDMGPKITLDSATLMNKAFEIMEAAWLYGVDQSRIGVVIHPQAVVHSMVEFIDGAVLAQLGPADMKLPIQYCLAYPEKMPSMMAPLDFSRAMQLLFAPPDTTRFPALELARQALCMGGLAGAVLNAANDAACARFRRHSLAFDEIAPAVADALAITPPGNADSLEAIGEAERLAWECVEHFAVRHTPRS